MRLRIITALAMAAIAGSYVQATTSAATTSGSMASRTKNFVTQMHACDASVALAISIVQKAPNDLIGASRTVNQAKSICSAIYHRMLSMDTSHFSDQALDGEIAVDYWTRGLGRFSNYIDNGLPSDVAKASEYFSDARSESTAALRGINQRRKVYGLGPLK